MESSRSILSKYTKNQNLLSSFSGTTEYIVKLDVVSFRGHPNIRATHKTTFEITRETYLSSRGDCIIGVNADKGLADLSQELKHIIRSENSVILVLLVDELGEYDLVFGRGDPRLELSDEKRIIVRRSTYVSQNTLAILSSKSAADLKRSLIEDLKRGVSARAYIIGLAATQKT
ncbi:MAG: DUF371 domain-containing protein [Desulfurococcaceae archaeon TW002]